MEKEKYLGMSCSLKYVRVQSMKVQFYKIQLILFIGIGIFLINIQQLQHSKPEKRSFLLHPFFTILSKYGSTYFKYRTRAIITRGLYIFCPIFQCGL